MFAIYKTITKKSINSRYTMSIPYIHILVIFIIKPLCVLIYFQMRNKLIVSKKLLLINSKYFLVWFSHLFDAGNGQKVVRI